MGIDTPAAVLEVLEAPTIVTHKRVSDNVTTKNLSRLFIKCQVCQELRIVNLDKIDSILV